MYYSTTLKLNPLVLGSIYSSLILVNQSESVLSFIAIIASSTEIRIHLINVIKTAATVARILMFFAKLSRLTWSALSSSSRVNP